MDRKNAENILMFSEAIAANGYKVLTRAKFIKYVTKTEISRFPNGLGKITWIDYNDDTDRYPRIGEIMDVKPKATTTIRRKIA